MIVHLRTPVGNGCSGEAADMKSVPARLDRRLQGTHLVGRLLRPLRVARPVFDRHRHRQPARSCGQRSSFSTRIRTGTRCTT